MRIHLLALPNAQTTKDYSLCGFTQATIRFGKILQELNHEVYLYASEENEIPCKELVTCITKEEIESLMGMGPWEYQYANIEDWSPLFQLFNSRAAKKIQERKQPHDIICQIGGYSQKYVSDRNQDLITVEWSIGYKGSFSDYRIFESRAWQHHTYGAQNIWDCRFYDTVIPCPMDPSDFKFVKEPGDYFVYVGRFSPKKGIIVACDIAARAGIKLKVVGHGLNDAERGHVNNAELLGALPWKERNEVMANAKAIIAPTLYIEPFGCSPVEAQMAGTPVICTDFGGFTETVEQGRSGYRCTQMGEFVKACKDIDKIDREYVSQRAVGLYSLHNLKNDYQQYFNRLQTLWNGGWYA